MCASEARGGAGYPGRIAGRDAGTVDHYPEGACISGKSRRRVIGVAVEMVTPQSVVMLR